jgi:hypothetical protein
MATADTRQIHNQKYIKLLLFLSLCCQEWLLLFAAAIVVGSQDDKRIGWLGKRVAVTCRGSATSSP